ncbi:hypothetical protein ACFV0H_33190 [Streptomyces erythrochromogenes]|uniref:Uncharacterized protein n=1 Tax=Streptomyces erythrochromogenes TaxID=285574 RepID=A0ABZ1QNJ6_9ACTN|nr:hypothetical protein [Streptomyces erythrochromogenes]
MTGSPSYGVRRVRATAWACSGSGMRSMRSAARRCLLKAATDGPNPIGLAFTGMSNPVQMASLPGIDSTPILISEPASGVSQKPLLFPELMCVFPQVRCDVRDVKAGWGRLIRRG